MRTRRSRLALGRIDALAILGVAIVCMGLLAPVLQGARDRAQLALCRSNLRHLALAVQAYHDEFRKLPPGYIGPMLVNEQLHDGVRAQNIGFLPMLLPYLEGEDLYRMFRTTRGIKPPGPAEQQGFDFDVDKISEPWWNTRNNYVISLAKLKAFLCPAQVEDQLPLKGEIWALHTVGTEMRAVTKPAQGEYLLGRTNYVGVAGCLGRSGAKNSGTPNDNFQQYVGLLDNRSQIKLGDVSDGTSNTLLIGEGFGGRVANGQREHSWTWVGVGAMWTYYGLSPSSPDKPALEDAFRFGSPHREGVQFAFADGSVRNIRRGKTSEIPSGPGNKPTDWTLLQQLAGYKDGMKFNVNSILD